MNIAVLSGISRSAGGIFPVVNALCSAMHRPGELTMQVYGAKTPLYEDDLPAWGSIPVQAYKAYGPLQTSFALRRWLNRSDADLVHRHGIWTDPQWAALQWHRKTGKPYLLSPHGMLDPWALSHSAWKKKIVGPLFANKSLKEAHCIHALCLSEVESIRACGLNNPVACIPNGVDLPVLDPNDLRPSSSGKKQLLFLGRIHPKKGIAELLKAWAACSGPRAGWKLIVAGWDDGNNIPALKALAAALEISDSVQFPGPKFGNEKDQLFRNADAFILPSFSEGLPVSVLEAWAYNLPVLMTEFCNIPEGFSQGAAIQIEPEEDSISRQLEAVMRLSSAELRAIGTNGRALVEKKFTWQMIAAEMKAVYEWCLGGGQPPSCIIEGKHDY